MTDPNPTDPNPAAPEAAAWEAGSRRARRARAAEEGAAPAPSVRGWLACWRQRHARWGAGFVLRVGRLGLVVRWHPVARRARRPVLSRPRPQEFLPCP